MVSMMNPASYYRPELFGSFGYFVQAAKCLLLGADRKPAVAKQHVKTHFLDRTGCSSQLALRPVPSSTQAAHQDHRRWLFSEAHVFKNLWQKSNSRTFSRSQA